MGPQYQPVKAFQKWGTAPSEGVIKLVETLACRYTLVNLLMML